MINFKAITGYSPFPFQTIRHDFTQQPICVLQCPTGSGKTEAYFVNWLLDLLEKPSQTPIRLIIQLPLRTLVEQTTKRVNDMVANSGMDIDVYTLMGGQIEDDFVFNTTKPSVIIGTLDQIVSRQLMRPYCASINAAPLHFHATNNNVRVVVDETQLQNRAYTTAVCLQSIYKKLGGFHPRELLLCSATLNKTPLTHPDLNIGNYGVIQVGEEDKKHPVYSKKFGREKTLHLHDEMPVDDVVDLINTKHIAGTMTLVVVNTVKRAQEIFGAIQGPKRILHSRFRKADRDQLQDGLKEYKGILISTQVVEAGIDLDARRLFTDLAPWSSIVQRAGRAGRNQSYDECDIHIFNTSQFLPYEDKDMKACWAHLNTLPNFNISTVLENSITEAMEVNYLTADVFRKLFDTTYTDLDAENKDVATADYIRGDNDGTVFVAWREQPSSTMPVVQRQEICNVPISEVGKSVAEVWTYDYQEKEFVLLAIQSTKDLSPGNVYVIDSKLGCYIQDVGWIGGSGAFVSEIQLNDVKARDPYPDSYPLDITQHLVETRDYTIEIMEETNFDDETIKQYVSQAGFYHDIGKAHEHFQWMIQGGNPVEGTLLAKNERDKVKGAHRVKGLRHEAHSALACVALEMDVEVIYLVMSHHGKIRTNFDHYHWKEEEEGRLHGVKEGDIIPSIPGVLEKPVEVQHIAPEQWNEIVEYVLDEYGEFKLAEMESIVRNADVMSSIAHQKE